MSDHQANLGRNADVIGMPGSRKRLTTPVLLLDLDVFDRNLEVMADHLGSSNTAVRPHAKGNKCGAVARRLIEAGAIGISCATLGEAEAMAEAGIESILVTSPVVGEVAVERLAALRERVPELIVVVDNADNVAHLSAVMAAIGQTLDVVVDCDVGLGRDGVTTPDIAVNLAKLAAASAGLRYRGVQAYYGHLQHVPAYDDRRAACAEQITHLRQYLSALEDAGFKAEIVSGGGTGTYHIDTASGVFTEIQPGTYPFMDRQYAAVAMTPEKAMPFGQAIFVQTTVVSVNQPGLSVVNGGWKAFATEGDVPTVARGAPDGTTYEFMGDEHGGIRSPKGGEAPAALGAIVEFVPPHSDPTINLYNHFHCVRGDKLVDIWPIEARGY